MLFDIRMRAPAKINIGLNVFRHRADGFHDIEGIFQTVGLYDYLYVSRLNEKRMCVVECDSFSLPADNTFVSAYNAFCRFTGADFGVRVILEKHIPAGGGLGGGSSDAASFIKALASLSEFSLDDETADLIASEVGSDVFFFLHAGEEKDRRGCALVSGRGDIVRAIEPRDDLYFLLVFPGVHSSTKEAYELVDKAYKDGEIVLCPEYADLEAVYNGSVKDWTFANTFTPVLVRKYPVIADALRDIKSAGALWADMSGSGATVFGVFDNMQDAKKAFTLLNESWNCCIVS